MTPFPDPLSAGVLYQLTPADIQQLRASMKQPVVTEVSYDTPSIILSPADGWFILHYRGRAVARCAQIHVLAAVLRMERAERGWIERALSSAETCIEALLGAADRAAAAARRREHEARQKLALADARDLTGTNLDDFL